MSVINAIIEIRVYRQTNGHPDIEECCKLLKVTPGSIATYDYGTAEELRNAPGLLEGMGHPRQESMREILRYLIFHLRPTWGLLIPQGRQIFFHNVSEDIKQCFESAGLSDLTPDAASITWWDSIADHFRNNSVLGQVELGRRGEALSMEYERRKLHSAGYGHLNPQWIAIEDNAAGYDLLSFETSTGLPLERYIEVKASEQSPFMFFISENEWRIAMRYGEKYVFHFWRLPSKEFQEVRVADVAPHIPENRGQGTWRKTQILWDGPLAAFASVGH